VEGEAAAAGRGVEAAESWPAEQGRVKQEEELRQRTSHTIVRRYRGSRLLLHTDNSPRVTHGLSTTGLSPDTTLLTFTFSHSGPERV
jgi:hypothetical protein